MPIAPIIDDIWIDNEGNIAVVWRIDRDGHPRFVGAPSWDAVRRVMRFACRRALDVEFETVEFGGESIPIDVFVAAQRALLLLHLSSVQH